MNSTKCLILSIVLCLPVPLCLGEGTYVDSENEVNTRVKLSRERFTRDIPEFGTGSPVAINSWEDYGLGEGCLELNVPATSVWFFYWYRDGLHDLYERETDLKPSFARLSDLDEDGDLNFYINRKSTFNSYGDFPKLPNRNATTFLYPDTDPAGKNYFRYTWQNEHFWQENLKQLNDANLDFIWMVMNPTPTGRDTDLDDEEDRALGGLRYLGNVLRDETTADDPFDVRDYHHLPKVALWFEVHGFDIEHNSGDRDFGEAAPTPINGGAIARWEKPVGSLCTKPFGTPTLGFPRSIGRGIALKTTIPTRASQGRRIIRTRWWCGWGRETVSRPTPNPNGTRSSIAATGLRRSIVARTTMGKNLSTPSSFCRI